MTVKQLSEIKDLTPVIIPCPERKISGGYVGDLLSWVMGRCTADSAWITIMSNTNVVAVATLADVSCVIFAENVTVDEEIKSIAEQKGINLISTGLSAYECAVMLGKLL